MNDSPSHPSSDSFDHSDAWTFVGIGVMAALFCLGIGGCSYLVAKGDAAQTAARHAASKQP